MIWMMVVRIFAPFALFASKFVLPFGRCRCKLSPPGSRLVAWPWPPLRSRRFARW